LAKAKWDHKTKSLTNMERPITTFTQDLFTKFDG